MKSVWTSCKWATCFWKSKWTQNVDIVWCVLDSISQGGKVLKSWKTWRIFCTSWIYPKTWRIFCTSWQSDILSSGTVCRVPINIASPALFIIKQKCHRTNEQAQTYFCALLFPEKYFSSWEWCCFVWERLVGLVSLKPWRKQPDSLHDFFRHINENEKNTTKDNLATTWLSFLTIKHWHHYTRLNSSLTFSVRFPSNIALLESEMETVMEFSSKIG